MGKPGSSSDGSSTVECIDREQRYRSGVDDPPLDGSHSLHERLRQGRVGVDHGGDIFRQQLGRLGEQELVDQLGGVGPGDVGAINGHLTATAADPREVAAWAAALEATPAKLPPITSTKSMIGHALGAAGAIESVASVLMLEGGFVHPSINCEDVHPEIEPYESSIPHTLREVPDMKVIVKAGFGFGDVNACLVFKRYKA